MPKHREPGLPSTLERSEPHAQHIYTKTHDSAVEQYGEGERAHRAAFAAVKHSYKKEGDRWLPKDKKGPSDPGAVMNRGGRNRAPTAGGREAPLEQWPREALYERARQLDIPGRSKMDKPALVSAIKRTA
jgi:cation transport regulator ChaB